MKTQVLLSVLAFVASFSAFSQTSTITLTFTADNNGQHMPLNSILIQNLTRGGDTTLFAPDTVLVLDVITGMAEYTHPNSHGFWLSQNFPNPVKGKTTFGLHLAAGENVRFTVCDIMGREVVSREFQLQQGSHSFTFYPGSEEFCFLTVHASDQTRTLKMLNALSGSGIPGLEYNGPQQTAGEKASGNATDNFVFIAGDLLKFTSFTSAGERVITGTPAGDRTYRFDYTGDPCPDTPTVSDIDGNVYNTVQIGSQCWMKENLKTTTYNNATPIPNVTDDDDWGALNYGAYVWYENNIAWKDRYGALYNWYATVDSNSLCPEGWHVPTHAEWTELTDYIGGTGSTHGNELKSCRQVNSPSGGGCSTNQHPRWNEYEMHYGTNDYGFSGLPGGIRNDIGFFNSLGQLGVWWSSTEYTTNFAWIRRLYYYTGNVSVFDYGKLNGFSVRCLRD